MRKFQLQEFPDMKQFADNIVPRKVENNENNKHSSLHSPNYRQFKS
jgi:hypothetical protein